MVAVVYVAAVVVVAHSEVDTVNDMGFMRCCGTEQEARMTSPCRFAETGLL